MDEQINNRIESFLFDRGQSKDTISKKQLNYLIKIDSEICKRLQQAVEAKKTIKSSEISIVSIANATGISRRTFYNNNELLKDYVSKYESKSITSDKNAEIKKMRDKNADLETQIKGFLKRDIDIMNLKKENDTLSAEIDRMANKVATTEKKYESVLIALNKANAELNMYKRN